MTNAVAEQPPAASAKARPKTLPGRRDDLVVRPVAGNQVVIKDPVTDTYFQLGEQEWFLLSQLDSTATSAVVLEAFQRRYDEELSEEDLAEFIEMVSKRHLLRDSRSSKPRSKTYVDSEDENWNDPDSQSSSGSKKKRQSILYWRKSLYDPDQLFNRWEPCLRWIWTVEFFVFSCAAIITAGIQLWTHRSAFIASFPQAFRWETAVAVWVTLILATICHEFAHGLTCKRFGGEVHEVGFLMMFMTPCLYCNVSDAWLFPSKWNRLLVTLAGAWCDLCIWALATFIWRLTVPDAMVNYLASVVLSVCGTRVFLNFNPLLKLDGYYLLSDWLAIPNLRGRSWERWLGWARHVLWGAPRPEPTPRDWVLVLYGVISWAFSAVFLYVVIVNIGAIATARAGWMATAITVFLGYFSIKRLFRGLDGGEIRKMVTTRYVRTALWLTLLAGAPFAMANIRMNENAGGAFQVRTGQRLEIRAEVAGFLKEVYVDEGNRVSQGALVARIEVPDLVSTIAQKTAAVQEAQANLTRLTKGARAEEIREQEAKVRRARDWRDLGSSDLASARQALKEELARYDQQIAQQKSEMDYAQQSLVKSERLVLKGVMAGEQLRSEKRKFQVTENLWQQSMSQKRTREASGVLAFEAELARREKDLADTEAALSLLNAGARPEEIEAERARLSRFQEELDFYQKQQPLQELRSTQAGILTTPRMKEKVGQFVEKGTVICTVEDLESLDAEIAIPEDKMEGIKIGQNVELKARAFPLKTFSAKVDRIAPIAFVDPAQKVATQSTVTIYCRVDNPQQELRSGMTGHARIYRGEKSLASMAGMGALRYFRTEFWW